MAKNNDDVRATFEKVDCDLRMVFDELNGGVESYRDVLNGVCKRLGLTDGTGLPEMDSVIYDELDRRLMPSGMEWPRFDDNGELVTDENCPDDAVGVFFALDGSCWAPVYDVPDNAVGMCERVKRPKPDPIGYDGLPINVGDMVWSAASDLGPFIVKEIELDEDREDPEDTVWCGEYTNGFKSYRIARHLTHTKPEPPDSWESLESDSEKSPFDYCEKVGHGLDAFEDAEEFKSADLVRRAKAFAERKEVE